MSAATDLRPVDAALEALTPEQRQQGRTVVLAALPALTAVRRLLADWKALSDSLDDAIADLEVHEIIALDDAVGTGPAYDALLAIVAVISDAVGTEPPGIADIDEEAIRRKVEQALAILGEPT